MYGYIYKTTNLINKKIYIGQKRASKFLGEKYLGSGKILKLAIEKYGIENFKIELLEEVNSQKELNEREIYWINFYNSQNGDIGYNRAPGGTGGNTTSHYRWYNDGVNDYYIEDLDDVPENFVSGRVQMKKKNPKGYVWINNGVIQKTIPKEDISKYPNWNRGMLDRGEEWRKNVVSVLKSYDVVEKRKLAVKKFRKEHPNFRASTCFKPGNTPHNKGKIWITNGGINKYIWEYEYDEYSCLGWRRGCTQKPRNSENKRR